MHEVYIKIRYGGCPGAAPWSSRLGGTAAIMNSMKRAAWVAALLMCLVVAGGAGGAETTIRRFDGKTVSSSRIE